MILQEYRQQSFYNVRSLIHPVCGSEPLKVLNFENEQLPQSSYNY
jgi:hypothetical protein